MQKVRYILVAVSLLLLVPIFSGCAIDPMESLTENIKAQSLDTRYAAVLQLANLNDDRTLDPLIEVLSSDDQLSAAAGVALVKKGREVTEPDPKQPNPVVDAVAKILNNTHLAAKFRARAAWVLGEIGDRRAIPALLTGLTALTGDKPAPLVRDQSKQALEKLGYYSTGRAFDEPMGTLRGHLDVLKQPPPFPATS